MVQPSSETSQNDWARAYRALHRVTTVLHARSDDLTATLDAVARGVVEATCFGAVAVNLALPNGDVKVVSVEGPPDARAMLLGAVEPETAWVTMIERSQPWGTGGLRFIPGDQPRPSYLPITEWVSPVAAIDHPDAWHRLHTLYAPLYASTGKFLGALCVDLPEGGRNPHPEQLEILELFADHAALAIEHAHTMALLHERSGELEYAATHDPLTGVANRARLDTAAAQMAALPAAHLAVLVLDVDGFKELNDTAGHQAGDAVLVEFAARMRRLVRDTDLLARTGGDEFVIVLSGRSDLRAAAARLLDRLQTVMSEPVIDKSGLHRLSVSIGVALAATPVRFEFVFAQADADMYHRKRRAKADRLVGDAAPSPQS